MKRAYRLFRRKNGVFYLHNNATGEQRSLRTSDRAEAEKLLTAENEARKDSALNLELGKVYIRAADPEMAKRTWQAVMDDLSSHGKEQTQARCKREMASKAFDIIRDKPLIQTTAEDLKAVLKRGGAATNNYLRRLHNLALGNSWIQWNIIAPKHWEKPKRKQRRGITVDEHRAILKGEQHTERRHYYQMLWLTGGAQSDCAALSNENIDRKRGVLSYQRQKTGEWANLEIGKSLKALLKQLPKEGLLFPYMANLSANDRAAEFSRRCRVVGIKGISLHSYRYAWAERAYSAGYNERFAQAALGHKSAAIHHAYARNGKVICPPLESSEPTQKIK